MLLASQVLGGKALAQYASPFDADSPSFPGSTVTLCNAVGGVTAFEEMTLLLVKQQYKVCWLKRAVLAIVVACPCPCVTVLVGGKLCVGERAAGERAVGVAQEGQGWRLAKLFAKLCANL